MPPQNLVPISKDEKGSMYIDFGLDMLGVHEQGAPGGTAIRGGAGRYTSTALGRGEPFFD